MEAERKVLKDAITNRGYSLYGFSVLMNVAPSTIYNHIQYKSDLRIKLAKKIISFFGGELDYNDIYK